MKGLSRPFRTRIAGEDQVVAELRRRTPLRGMRKRVAHDLGVSENTLSRILSGKSAPSLEVAAGLGFQLIKAEDPTPS